MADPMIQAIRRTQAFIILLNARSAYVRDQIDLDEFEHIAEECIRNGA